MLEHGAWRDQARRLHGSCTSCLALGSALARMILTRPSQLGHFGRSFATYMSPDKDGEQRLRDVLPLPTPALPTLELSPAGRGGPCRARRRAMAADDAREVWSWLVVTALNYEYCGRQPEATW